MDVNPKIVAIFNIYQQYLETPPGHSVSVCYDVIFPFGGDDQPVDTLIINSQPVSKLPPVQFQKVMVVVYGHYKLNSEDPEYFKDAVLAAMEYLVKLSKEGQDIPVKIISLPKK
jgi:hypothetical protein